jgi:hypothetical protein
MTGLCPHYFGARFNTGVSWDSAVQSLESIGAKILMAWHDYEEGHIFIIEVPRSEKVQLRARLMTMPCVKALIPETDPVT